MDVRAMTLIVGSLFCASSLAAPGEKGGAYGGGTSGEGTKITMPVADTNGDGVINEQEARRVGIERFDVADKNHDGVLDEAELSALETADPANSGPDAKDKAAPDGQSK